MDPDEQINNQYDGKCTVERKIDNEQSNLNQPSDLSTETAISHEQQSIRVETELNTDLNEQEQQNEDNQSVQNLNQQEDDDKSQSTNSSSHPPPVLVKHQPNYLIAVLPGELEVDEYSIYYAIKAIKISNKNREDQTYKLQTNKDLPEVVKREHDDFLYLNHVLVNSAYPGYGLIVPPLISKPNLDDIYLTTQELLFNRNALLTNLLFDDQWQKECWFLQQYLHAMLNHQTFGKDPFWPRFLEVLEPPPKIKLKKNNYGNLFSSLFQTNDQETLFSASKGTSTKLTHRDCDDWFQRERDWLHYYQYLMKEALDSFNTKTAARTRLCNTLEHLATTLTLNYATDEGVLSRILSKLNNTFSKSLIDCSNVMQIMSLNDETTIACTFEFFEKYLRNAKEMMNNRVCLLIDYENANRNLDKAKTGSKRQAAEKLKYESEKIFEDCSEIARIELKHLHQEINQKLTESIENYAKWQLITNQELLKVMKNAILLLEQI